MDKQQLDETLACLDQRKWLLHFSKDIYAAFLLQHWLGKNGPASVGTLKKMSYGKLLERPLIKSVTACSQILEAALFENLWPDLAEPIILTLGRWGGEQQCTSYQVSRQGYNLVLQVNLNEQWNEALQTMFATKANSYLDCGHPINLSRSSTLGWVRIDFDFETDEVLIEEVQSDLVRRIAVLHRYALKAKQDQCEVFRLHNRRFRTNDVLKGLQGLNSAALLNWQETLLWSALWFCTQELGMDQIYYHTFETGAVLKNIQWGKPPRSLYTQLPRKFCFEQTTQAPKMLMQSKPTLRRLKAVKNAAFFKLAA